MNAAGLRSDEIDRMLGGGGFSVTPRRGELIVFDKLARPLVNHVVLAVPTKVSKGVLVSPTVFGNVMVGPTADDIEDKSDTSSTAAGLDYLRREAARIMPALLGFEVTAVYVGLRAATEHVDFQIRFEDGYACVAGIRSTGLTAALAIAEHVRLGLGHGERGGPGRARGAAHAAAGGGVRRGPMPTPSGSRPIPTTAASSASASGSRAGRSATPSPHPIPPVDLDGLRRRTRAHMGRCQGFFCGAALAALLEGRDG